MPTTSASTAIKPMDQIVAKSYARCETCFELSFLALAISSALVATTILARVFIHHLHKIDTPFESFGILGMTMAEKKDQAQTEAVAELAETQAKQQADIDQLSAENAQSLEDLYIRITDLAKYVTDSENKALKKSARLTSTINKAEFKNEGISKLYFNLLILLMEKAQVTHEEAEECIQEAFQDLTNDETWQSKKGADELWQSLRASAQRKSS